MNCPNCKGLRRSHGEPVTRPILPFASFLFSALIQTSKSGCASCTFLSYGIGKFVTTEEDIERIEIFEYKVEKHRYALRLEIFCYTKDRPETIEFYTDDCKQQSRARHNDWENELDASLTLKPESDYSVARVSSHYPFLSTLPHISEDNSGPACFATAKRWLDHCTSSHSPRCPPDTPTKLPTRVIAVGSSTINPRLYETRRDEEGHYAALSYCWGRTRAFTTTISTYANRTSGFRLEELPKTCKDAVIVARGLGIPYVWIDSLCIVQDSSSDWEIEAALMCSVYENALVTFAALDSPDSETGLFVAYPERGTVKLDVQIPGRIDEGKQKELASIYVRRSHRYSSMGIIHTRSYPGTKHSTHVCKLDFEVLDTRGWTLQEITLSPRLLWFSGSELAWSCNCATACECEPGMTAEWLDGSAKGMSWELPETSEEQPDGGLEKCLRMWDDLVLAFTKRNLSFMKDRAPAIAGLAAVLQRRLTGRYLCGLWEVDLKRQLLWGNTYTLEEETQQRGGQNEQQQQTVPAGYAPSWTWASVTGVTLFIETTRRPKFRYLWKIMDVQFTATRDNIYGPGEGSIELESLIVSLEVVNDHFVYNGPLSSSSSPARRFCKTTESFLPDQRSSSRDIDTLLTNSLFCIIAGYLVKKQGSIEEVPWLVLGLMLEQDQYTLKYRRIGLVEVKLDTEENEGTWLDWEKRGQMKRITLT